MFPKIARKRLSAVFAFIFCIVIFSIIKFGVVSENVEPSALVPNLSATKTGVLDNTAAGSVSERQRFVAQQFAAASDSEFLYCAARHFSAEVVNRF